ncbi:MAG TPA: hypothetical protein ENF89_01265 [Candidatus Bathyarchaeota archaeon]|mgnify:CR=1 FL=1|nr:hypothetical protein [Candidatus Bathyarchaeota archaeon]
MSIGEKPIGWRQLHRLIGELADGIRASNFKPDIIIGLGRRGWVFARLLSDHLGVSDLITLHASIPIDVGRISLELRNRRILIAFDVEEAADALGDAIQNLRDYGASEIRTATLLLPRSSKIAVDYHHSLGEEVIYPWELHRRRGA